MTRIGDDADVGSFAHDAVAVVEIDGFAWLAVGCGVLVFVAVVVVAMS